MADRSETDPGPGTAGLYDVQRLAVRLGWVPSSVRTARRRGTLPEPDGWLNNGPVWHETTLEGIEGRMRPRGRPPGSSARRSTASDQR